MDAGSLMIFALCLNPNVCIPNLLWYPGPREECRQMAKSLETESVNGWVIVRGTCEEFAPEPNNPNAEPKARQKKEENT
jgi:hypothetical protein